MEGAEVEKAMDDTILGTESGEVTQNKEKNMVTGQYLIVTSSFTSVNQL